MKKSNITKQEARSQLELYVSMVFDHGCSDQFVLNNIRKEFGDKLVTAEEIIEEYNKRLAKKKERQKQEILSQFDNDTNWEKKWKKKSKKIKKEAKRIAKLHKHMSQGMSVHNSDTVSES